MDIACPWILKPKPTRSGTILEDGQIGFRWRPTNKGGGRVLCDLDLTTPEFDRIDIRSRYNLCSPSVPMVPMVPGTSELVTMRRVATVLLESTA